MQGEYSVEEALALGGIQKCSLLEDGGIREMLAQGSGEQPILQWIQGIAAGSAPRGARLHGEPDNPFRRQDSKSKLEELLESGRVVGPGINA